MWYCLIICRWCKCSESKKSSFGQKKPSFCCWGCRFQVGEALIGQVQRVLWGRKARLSLNFELSLGDLAESPDSGFSRHSMSLQMLSALSFYNGPPVNNCKQVCTCDALSGSAGQFKHFTLQIAPNSCSDVMDAVYRLKNCLWETNCIHSISASNG